MDSTLDIKGIIECMLLVVFGVTINQNINYIHELFIDFDSQMLNDLFDYAIKTAVLTTAIIKAVIEFRKIRKKKKNE